jgi:hypothetical protein
VAKAAVDILGWTFQVGGVPPSIKSLSAPSKYLKALSSPTIFRIVGRAIANLQLKLRTLYILVDFGFSTSVCEHDNSADDTIRVMSR